MGKYKENISDYSIWITATPTNLTQTLPFYIVEAGLFIAGSNYLVKRERHDSFLLLYTIEGQGTAKSGSSTMQLSQGDAVIIDCHIPHEYHIDSDRWKFLWIHFKGNSTEALFHILYPDSAVRTVHMQNPYEFERSISALLNKANKNNVANSINISSDMHVIMNSIYLSASANDGRKKEYNDDIQTVIKFIEKNYSSSISVDDMIKNIHISKYHFIRSFHKVMGITPYSYLTNYRITVSKTLLRSTTKTVSEIAEECGFLDTSNFITQFKKHTGQRPLQYRHDFS